MGFDDLDSSCHRSEHNSRHARIYVVEDDSAVRAAVSMLVRACGWEAVPCSDAEDFLQRYTPGRHQCVILDLRMPGLSGVELQGALRERGDDVPVIVVTAHADQPDAALARSAGARVVLGKPFKDMELVDNLQQALALD
jgi:FixJ family two-component response regulator